MVDTKLDEKIHSNMASSMGPMLEEFFKLQMPQADPSVKPSNLDCLPFIEHMVIMLLTNPQFRMFLKVHFHILNARQIVALRQGKMVADISDRVAIDYMKELCNVLGGRLKKRIAYLDFDLGQSIPLDLEGFSEIFFHDVNWSSQTLTFQVMLGQHDLHVSAQYEVTGAEAQQKLASLTTQEPASEDDIEFL
jgi:hypothetical protein